MQRILPGLRSDLRSFWISSPRFTIQVDVDERDIIRWSAPVARIFVGQPLKNLIRWAKADRIEELHQAVR